MQAHSKHSAGLACCCCCPLSLLQVLECWDRKRKDYVAVKIIRNIQVSCAELAGAQALRRQP